ncbi:MAG TPA: sugar phosphate isomerase/epimerase family protein [Candidatus Sulfotelmatobacter sp.]|nr:sugar phosphate isomerase/epimerase family protein [Candidatus Sulfotelmatobacter sp.]
MSLKMSFSTLACPDWTIAQIIAMASGEKYDGIELRFVQGEDSLWNLPVFSGAELASTKRALADHAVTISCVGTSCRFDSPDAAERRRWRMEGERMADLAAELNAPGLRVFGDTIRTGTDRASTQGWIADSVRTLAGIAKSRGVEVWIENHGDFVTAEQTAAILAQADCPNAGVVWDPANSYAAAQEQPSEGAALLGAAIRHVHIKDMQRQQDGWKHVLSGEGEFPLLELKSALKQLHYDRFLSFEWEKKWHPEIADPEVALPHFARWFRQSCAYA